MKSTMRPKGILFVRLADDCGACRERKASGILDLIRKEIEPEYKMIEDEVKYREIGNPKLPDLFNYPHFTPYFMFMLTETYEMVLKNNPDPAQVLNYVRLYNWMAMPDYSLIKKISYHQFFEEVPKFCRDSYFSLTGDKEIVPSTPKEEVQPFNAFPRKARGTLSSFRG